MSETPWATDNARTYERSAVLGEYTGDTTSGLWPSERAVLAQAAPGTPTGAVLDLGVGAGRTTAELSAHAVRYLGVDGSAAMVEACRRRFPGVPFAHGDARRLDLLPPGLFDLVAFSFNGIDEVGFADRTAICRQVHARLNAGGVFWFSSHNLRTSVPTPWQLWSGRSADLGALLRGTWNRWRRAHLASSGRGYALRVDCAYDFSLVLCFVDPSAQVQWLEAVGFAGVRVFDINGVEHPHDAPALADSVHVHFVARKA